MQLINEDDKVRVFDADQIKELGVIYNGYLSIYNGLEGKVIDCCCYYGYNLMVVIEIELEGGFHVWSEFPEEILELVKVAG